jgi:hypothetical protein
MLVKKIGYASLRAIIARDETADMYNVSFFSGAASLDIPAFPKSRAGNAQRQSKTSAVFFVA